MSDDFSLQFRQETAQVEQTGGRVEPLPSTSRTWLVSSLRSTSMLPTNSRCCINRSSQQGQTGVEIALVEHIRERAASIWLETRCPYSSSC